MAVRIGRRALGRTLIAGGGLVLAAFCALGAWAAIDFDGLFAAFHSLFFQAGTWTFPYDSLLITLSVSYTHLDVYKRQRRRRRGT